MTMDLSSDASEFRRWCGLRLANKKVSESKQVLLIVSVLPLPYCLKLERLIAHSMQEKGYKIVFLTNRACYSKVKAYTTGFGDNTIIVLEDYLSSKGLIRIYYQLRGLFSRPEGIISKVKAFKYRGANTGLHALASLSAQSNDGGLNASVRHVRRLVRLMLRSALYTDAAIEIIKDVQPSLVLAGEKGFVGTCEIFYAALSASVDYVQWCGCHEPNSIMLKRYNYRNSREHPFSLSEDTWRRILEDAPKADRLKEQVFGQFEEGYSEGSWFKYKSLTHGLVRQGRQELFNKHRLDLSKKTAIIYSHILNDANLFYGVDLFEAGYEEWLIETVRAAASNDLVNWVLKLHPANVSRNAKSGYVGEFGELIALKNAFGSIPEFLRVVYPNESTSPFSFFKITDYGVTVRGTVGLELPCFGVPVLTAGTGRYSKKGFTVDSDSREEYLAMIRNIHQVKALSSREVELAHLYAYMVFCVRPAKYDAMFSDEYLFPVGHERHRDVYFGDNSLSVLLKHPQMSSIIDFMSSRAEDFLNPFFSNVSA